MSDAVPDLNGAAACPARLVLSCRPQTNRFKGGIPRCSQYCGRWGCGVNQSLHFNTTAEGGCEPPTLT